MIAAFSQSSSQKSRGREALCWLGVPSLPLQRLNLLMAIPSQPTKSKIGRFVRPAQRLDELDDRIADGLGTQTPFRVPQVLFLV